LVFTIYTRKGAFLLPFSAFSDQTKAPLFIYE